MGNKGERERLKRMKGWKGQNIKQVNLIRRERGR